MPTIKDVAKEAGVAFKTVSRVVNNDMTVKPQNRQRVEEAIRKLGYRPNHAAQMMRAQKSQSIGFITDMVASTPHSVGFIKGAQERAWLEEKLLIIVNTDGKSSVQRRAIEMMAERKVEGIVYATMYRQTFETFPNTYDIPTVLLNCSMKDQSFTSVLPDDFEAAKYATGQLLRTGHKQIAYINLLLGSVASLERLAGYRKALEQKGIEFRPELVRTGYNTLGFDKWTVIEATHALMSLPKPPTAFFCGNDKIAIGVYEGVKALGKQIPQDVAVIGFDDYQLITLNLTPTLSTMDLPFLEMGQKAVNYLLTDWQKDPTPTQIIVSCPFIERGSC